ncbi:hypothetical protein, partial [Prevotella corporis]|uniref:hypothetical protein n=1 Tax=Prevotella corporis TaxID=28128 RepID=UPI001EE21334
RTLPVKIHKVGFTDNNLELYLSTHNGCAYNMWWGGIPLVISLLLIYTQFGSCGLSFGVAWHY